MRCVEPVPSFSVPNIRRAFSFVRFIARFFKNKQEVIMAGLATRRQMLQSYKNRKLKAVNGGADSSGGATSSKKEKSDACVPLKTISGNLPQSTKQSVMKKKVVVDNDNHHQPSSSQPTKPWAAAARSAKEAKKIPVDRPSVSKAKIKASSPPIKTSRRVPKKATVVSRSQNAMNPKHIHKHHKKVVHQSIVVRKVASKTASDGNGNLPRPPPRSTTVCCKSKGDSSPHVAGGMMMMFSPPSRFEETTMTEAKLRADKIEDLERSKRVEKMKSNGMLMSFSPPKRVKKLEGRGVERRPSKPFFGMSFTPGGTLMEGGMDMENTPEELRKMRERIRLQEEVEQKADDDHDTGDAGDADAEGGSLPQAEIPSPNELAAFLGDHMDAEKSLDVDSLPATPPKTPAEESNLISDIDFGTPAEITAVPQHQKLLTRTKKELAKTLDELIAAERCNTELTEALRMSVEEKEKLTESNSELLSRVNALEKSDLDSETNNAELNYKLNELKVANAHLVEERDCLNRELQREKSDAEREMAALQTQIEGLKKCVKDITSSSKSKDSSNEQDKAVAKALKATNESLKAQVQEWKNKVKSIQRKTKEDDKEDLATANSTIAALETRVKTLDANLVVTNTNLKGTTKQLADSVERSNTMQASFQVS